MSNINLATDVHCQQDGERPVSLRTIHFIKWWLGFTGLIAASSICPFCGRPGCPVGIGAATTMGGILSLFMQNWKEPLRWLHRRCNNK